MRMTVIGTGYLGATHAVGMAELGHEVIGVDVEPAKIRALAAGRPPFYEPGLGPSGRVCSCGSQGCWEAEVRACWEAGAHGGCPDRQAQLSHWLALGIANLVNIFNPEMVVLGGGFGEVYPRIASLLATECAGFVVPPYRTGWRLVASSLGRDAPLVGAAEVAFAKLFTDPLRASAVPPACKTLLPIRRSGCEGEFQA